MAIEGTWTVQLIRTENLETIVTDFVEQTVWEFVDRKIISVDATRAEYDEWPEEKRACFLAQVSVMANLGFSETTGTGVAAFSCSQT